jgi:hypothetical protein
MCGRSTVANYYLTVHDFQTDHLYLNASFDIVYVLCLKLSSVGIEPILCSGRPGSFQCFVTVGNVSLNNHG